MSALRAGLIGFPVEHSLSPVFQQAAFDALRIPARYDLWPTPPEELAARIAGLRETGTLGANVTVPHKPAVFRLLDEVSERARRAGAVNTVINQRGTLLGDNTDIPGFLAPLRERGLALSGARVVVLGAGGAARGVVVALLLAGCPEIVVVNRTAARARALAEEIGGPVQAQPTEALGALLPGATLLVNATALGWGDGSLPLAPDLLDRLPGDALVYDLTYRKTPLLASAAERGRATLDGLPMLVHQGAESFRLWTGQEPPLSLMLAIAERARDERATA